MHLYGWPFSAYPVDVVYEGLSWVKHRALKLFPKGRPSAAASFPEKIYAPHGSVVALHGMVKVTDLGPAQALPSSRWAHAQYVTVMDRECVPVRDLKLGFHRLSQHLERARMRTAVISPQQAAAKPIRDTDGVHENHASARSQHTCALAKHLAKL